MHEYGLTLSPLSDFTGLEALVVAVAHDEYVRMDPARLRGFFADPASGLVMDIRGTLDRAAVEAQGLTYWRL